MSTQAYALCKLRQPPTVIQQCIEAHLKGGDETHLVLAKTHFLQIFRISLRSDAPDLDNNNSEPTLKPVLDLIYEKRLFGNIESVCAVRYPHKDRDSLLLSFRDAKASIVEFDPPYNDFRIYSLHFFEDERFKDQHEAYTSLPILKTDPKQSCAVMLIYDTKLVVIPFRSQDKILLDDEDDMDEGEDESAKAAPKSFIIDLAAMGIRNIKDYIFLNGYFEPTLLILHEPILTWTGRLAIKRDTCALTAISLTFSQQVNPIVWDADNLPYDSTRLEAVPDPIGGAFVFSTNYLLYFNQNNRYGLLVNDTLPAEYVHNGYMREKSSINMTLDASTSIFLAPERMLVSLKGGELCLFHLNLDARNVQSVAVTRAGSSVLTSCMCRLNKDLLFLGSRFGDSLLLLFAEKAYTMETQQDDFDLEQPGKKIKSESGAIQAPVLDRSLLLKKDLTEEEADDLLYNTSASGNESSGLTGYSFQVCDSVPNIGAIAHSAIGTSVDPATESQRDHWKTRPLEKVVCAGYGKNGSISVIQQGVRPDLNFGYDLPGHTALWTVRKSGFNLNKKRRNKIDLNETEEKLDNYLIITKQQGTLVLELGENFEEVTDKVGFVTDETTLNVGNLLSDSRICQITETKLRILKGGVKKGQGLSFQHKILSSTILDPYVLILFEGNKMELIRLGNSDEITKESVQLPEPSLLGGVTACSLFVDEARIFGEISPNLKEEDEDDLYGSDTKPKIQRKNTLLILTRENNRLEIYLLPEFQLVFATPQFNKAPALIYHSLEAQQRGKKENVPTSFFVAADRALTPDPIVRELMMCCLDPNSSMPYLMVNFQLEFKLKIDHEIRHG
eukprot:TRINITY_DN4356_c0_g1_i2.p1 TRINITY_DN4356_c0_g1~~TRINITY_DN4356_c0_g1_i2.p1  ORF type:complete len:842 (-),score=254.19 TRINITY_DN4356_c0_g1_i2:3-2528(-)